MRTSIAVMTALVLGAAACGDSGAGEGDGSATTAGDSLTQRANAVAAVDLAVFTADPDAYVGQEIRLADAPVDSHMGTQGLWIKLPNQGLYLVRGTAENTGSVERGARVSVVGPILEMNDSVVAAWIEDGSITADQEMEARYATSYMDAWYVSSGQQTAAGAAQE